MKAQQEAIAAGETPAPFSAVEVAKAAETAGGGKSDAAEKQPAAVKEIGGEPEAAGAVSDVLLCTRGLFARVFV